MGTKRYGYAGNRDLIAHMPSFQDPAYLSSDQYKNADNLVARVRLHERFSTNPYGWFRWVFNQLDLPPEARVLEVGCGSGALWANNLLRIPSGWNIILSDFSPGMVEDCYTNLLSPKIQCSFIVSNAFSIPFPAETFDGVIANHMLYHVADRPRVLGEIARVLKTGGRLYAATNGEKHLRELDQIMDKAYSSSDFRINPVKPSSDFSLENGSMQLNPLFGQVKVRIYQDGLRVTEAEPLIAYIRSMIPRNEEQRDEVMAHAYKIINDEITSRGHIHIQKSSGLFIAQK